MEPDYLRKKQAWAITKAARKRDHADSERKQSQDNALSAEMLYAMTIPFLEYEGLTSLDTVDGLKEALAWLNDAEPDDMFLTMASAEDDADGGLFDEMIGAMRRSMMMETVERLLREKLKES